MMLALLQIFGLTAFVAYLWYIRTRIKRRNAQTWASLLAELRPDWSASELSNHFLWEEGTSATTEDAWTRMDGPRGLWAIYQNASVLQQMTDYAARNYPGIDPLLIAALRSDAMQIRLCVLMALGQYAFTQASAGVRVNAYRAASLYMTMAAQMTRLLQEHAAAVLPDYVAAM